MHMADALISPAVGGAMWTAAAAVAVHSARKVQNQLDNRKIPLMGVLGAFVFAAQMINFAIPGTGSSGHLGGGLLLAILLGPHGAFLTLASVLTVQALFFADGGLLALGCNIFNLGFFPCFIAYPLIYKTFARKTSAKRLALGSTVAAIAGLQLGAFAVVLQTFFSGISSLPLPSFLLVMQPIHLAIGLAEGIATAGIVSFIWKARPEILDRAMTEQPLGNLPVLQVVLAILAATILTGGILAWYGSENPDGLEWSIQKVTGQAELDGKEEPLYDVLEKIQKKTSLMPDYSSAHDAASQPQTPASERKETTAAGLFGGLIILAAGLLLGFILKKRGPAS